MAAHRLDEQALEARTQAIGRALFEAARRQHAHLSALNRWTAQILSWCLSDPAVKSSVLRFIDVLPSLAHPRQIVAHIREYFPRNLRLPAALRLGSTLAGSGLLTQRVLTSVVHQAVEQVARQFIAEQRPEEAVRVIQTLAASGTTCSLDILGEHVVGEAEADRYVQQCRTLLGHCARAYETLPNTIRLLSCGPRANVSIKPSALTPRFDPISPDSSIQRAAARLLPVLQDAAACSATVHLDMEQYELRDLTLALAKHLLGRPDGVPPNLGVAVQAYVRDAEAVVNELIAWLQAQHRRLTIRLVKGAYWDAEVATARQAHWPEPVYLQKGQTDAAFERLTRRLLGAASCVTTAVASHNIRSIAHAMALAEQLGVERSQLEFQVLYGMGEAIQGAIVSFGYPVRVYTPIGELIPGMAYLVRRILENTANESFLRQELFEAPRIDELLAAPDAAPAAMAGTMSAPSGGWIPEPWTDFAQAHSRESMAQAIAAVRCQLGGTYPALIGERELQSSRMLTGRNPARPEETLGRISCAEAEQVEEAVRIATEAQPCWASAPVERRVACLRRAAVLLRPRRLELAAWAVLEVGKTWREADADVIEAIEYLEYYSHAMLALASGRSLPQLPGERNAYVYQPRGVAVVIAPWNFPAAIVMGMTAAALVSGHPVLLKPSEQSSLIAAHLVRLLREAGVPPGVIQLLPGAGEEVGSALVQHPQTHVVLFTGSRAVGLSILRICASVPQGQRFIKHAIVEMGGKNAIIVDADADLDAAVLGILHSAFSYGGQKCSAASRLIVHEAVYERVLSRLAQATDRLVIGDPADPGTDLGPLIDATAQQRLREAIERAQRVGRLAYRFPDMRLPASGYFVGPAIAAEVPPDDALAQEELFGPLLCAFRVKSFEEALALANDTAYALTGGVYSRSPSHLEVAIRSFDVGNLYLNRPITGALVGRQPFGGHRLSGLGTKAGGPDYLLQLLVPKTICANTARHGIPLESPSAAPARRQHTIFSVDSEGGRV